MPLSRRHILFATPSALLWPSLAASQADAMYDALLALVDGDARSFPQALDAIAARGNPDMAAGVIDAMRFTSAADTAFVEVLRKITGQDGGEDWFSWMVWQEGHPEIVPHPSYARWKREIYLRIDPDFDLFLNPQDTRRDRMKIRLEEITWGGVRKDGIPSLDFPQMIPATAADYLRGDDLVFGIAINGDVRAYPLRIMGWHEMFNDVIGGVPVALAYCTLCGSGILFETQVKGRKSPLIFGSSGFLYRSNKLMFDRATNSLWNQFTGKPVSGALVSSGIELAQRPVVIAKWKDWRAANPATRVLSLETGYDRNYGSGVVYRDYFASKDLMFPAAVDDKRLKQKDYVFGLRLFGGAKAWPISAFARRQVINDSFAGHSVVLIGDATSRTVRAYDRGDEAFTQAGAGLKSADGTIWQAGEEAITAPDGRSLPRLAGQISYWFAWNGYVGAASEFYQE